MDFSFIGEKSHVVVGFAFNGEYKQVLKDGKVDAVTITFFWDATFNNLHNNWMIEHGFP